MRSRSCIGSYIMCISVAINGRSLLTARLHYGKLDDGGRFHVISHLIRETVNCGKSMLATGIMGKDDPSDSGSNMKEAGTIHALIQQDRVLAAVCYKLRSSVFSV